MHLLGIRFVGTSADVIHYIPLMRWLTCLGVVSASKSSILKQIRRGVHVGIVPVSLRSDSTCNCCHRMLSSCSCKSVRVRGQLRIHVCPTAQCLRTPLLEYVFPHPSPLTLSQYPLTEPCVPSSTTMSYYPLLPPTPTTLLHQPLSFTTLSHHPLPHSLPPPSRRAFPAPSPTLFHHPRMPSFPAALLAR